MNIDISEIKKTLELSALPEIGKICVFITKTIDLENKDLLVLPKHTLVSLFFFESEKQVFAGIVTDFVLESTAKSADPFEVENEIAEIVKEIGAKIGLINAKCVNLVKDSTAEVEGLPFGTGDCFIFSL